MWDGPDPIVVDVAVDPGLDRELTRQHLTALATAAGPPAGVVTVAEVTDPSQLAVTLAEERMDVVYLYCHCGYLELASGVLASVVLRFGTAVLDPTEVSNWRSVGGWPRPHWPDRKPLVVLNGCHTAELTTAALGLAAGMVVYLVLFRVLNGKETTAKMMFGGVVKVGQSGNEGGGNGARGPGCAPFGRGRPANNFA